MCPLLTPKWGDSVVITSLAEEYTSLCVVVYQTN